MAISKDFYCWVKVARTAVPSPAPAPTDDGQASTSADRTTGQDTQDLAYNAPRPPGSTMSRLGDLAAAIGPLNGPRPPNASTTGQADAAGAQGGVLPMNGPRPPNWQLAGYAMLGWWGIDSDFAGVGGSGAKVELRPVLGTRDDALNWLESGEGIAWLGQPSSYVTFFLMVFNAGSDC